MQPQSLWQPPPIIPSPTVNRGPQMCQALFWVLWNTAPDKKQNLLCLAACILLELAEEMKPICHLCLPGVARVGVTSEILHPQGSGIVFLISTMVTMFSVHTPGLSVWSIAKSYHVCVLIYFESGHLSSLPLPNPGHHQHSLGSCLSPYSCHPSPLYLPNGLSTAPDT